METIKKGISYIYKYLFLKQDEISLLRSYDTKKQDILHILSMETDLTIKEIDDYTLDKVLTKKEGCSTLFHQVELLEDMMTNVYIRHMMEADIHQKKKDSKQESRFIAEWKTCKYLLQTENIYINPSLTKREVINLYHSRNNIF
tara:strand:+ start:623 stop:1054 length:432 start_codon:yes stop_codon:yes gene_type:complete